MNDFKFGGICNDELTIKQLEKHEGFRDNYYLCSSNKKTIGYGRNIEDNPFSKKEIFFLGRVDFDKAPMIKNEAEYLLLNDIKKIETSIKTILPWSKMNNARKAVCVNMAFNLGVGGFCKFKRMIDAINNAFYEKAAVEMLDSKWAKQVGNRATELSEQMKNGVFKVKC